MSQRILILGGGIGGLCMSMALRKVGLNAVLYEQAEKFGHIGAGIQVWVKGMQALHQLDIAETVRKAGSEVHYHRFFNASGAPLYAANLAVLAEKTGAPLPVMITRTALIEALNSGVDMNSVDFDRRVTAVESDERKVRISFHDGSFDEGDLLIAADGIDSLIRRSIFPEIQTRTATYRYVRSLVNHAPPFGAHTFAMFFGRGNRIAVGDCGDQQLYLTGLKRPAIPLDGDLSALKGDLLQRFYAFPRGITSVIDATPAEMLIHHTVRDLRPIEEWGRGRIFLLGDAAHATTPNLGRGSGQAMLDAITLAPLLRDIDLGDMTHLRRVLRTYTSMRKAEAENLQKTSWTIGNITSWDGFITTKARDTIMRTIAGRKQIANIERQFIEAAQMPNSLH